MEDQSQINLTEYNHDIIYEIMTHLGFDLLSFSLTNKKFVKIYENHMKSLCNFGKFQLSDTQKYIREDIITYSENISRIPLFLYTHQRRGIKWSLLSLIDFIKVPVVIITDNLKLWDEACIRIGDLEFRLKITITPIFSWCHMIDPFVICNKLEVDGGQRLHIYYKKKVEDAMGGKKLVIINKTNKISPCNLIYKSIHYQSPNDICAHHICCYRSDTPYELYLPPLTNSLELEPQDERLESIISKLINDFSGPYCIVDDQWDNNVSFINFPYFKCDYGGEWPTEDYRTIIFLWPIHYTLSKINNMINDLLYINLYQVRLIYIHSTEEEELLLRKSVDMKIVMELAALWQVRCRQTPRKKKMVLTSLRKLNERVGIEKLRKLRDQDVSIMWYIHQPDEELLINNIISTL